MTTPTNPTPTAHPSQLFSVVSTNDTTRSRYSTVLYKGAPLTGKTHCLGTWTGAGPLLYILFDPKSETISQFPDVHIVAPKDVATFHQQILPRIKTGTMTDNKGAKLDYASVAIDSISFWAKDTELSIAQTDGDMPKGGWMQYAAKVGRALGELGAIARNPDHPHPANFLATVHEKDLKKRVRLASGEFDTVSEGWIPKVAGGLQDNLEGYFDLTLLTFTEMGLAPAATPGASRVPKLTYACRTIGQERRQQAGGSFRGLTGANWPPVVDGTYQGLCALADKVGKE